MTVKRPETRSLKAPTAFSVRVSISFPHDLYELLEELAKQKNCVPGVGGTGRGGEVRRGSKVLGQETMTRANKG